MSNRKNISVVFILLLGGGIFSCGNMKTQTPGVAAPAAVIPLSELDRTCATNLFNFGRPLSAGDLKHFNRSKFGLESVHFREVLFKNPNEVELAYLVEVKMRLAQNQFLVPEPEFLCRETPRPSAQSEKLSRTMIPVIGDLHLPSTRITVFDTNEGDRLYNYPRIAEISVSSAGYFSFNQNWAPYRKLTNLTDYIDLLKTRHFYSKVDVRELTEGRIAIYAEKQIGGEKAQLLVTLSEVQN